MISCATCKQDLEEGDVVVQVVRYAPAVLWGATLMQSPLRDGDVLARVSFFHERCELPQALAV